MPDAVNRVLIIPQERLSGHYWPNTVTLANRPASAMLVVDIIAPRRTHTLDLDSAVRVNIPSHTVVLLVARPVYFLKTMWGEVE